MPALVESGLPVEDLLLYSAEASITCSLPRNQVMFPSLNKLHVLATNLRCLSISISAPCKDKSDNFNQYEECQEEDDFDGLNTLIASLPGLKILDIHYYTLEGKRPDPISCDVNPSLLCASFNWEQYSPLALERMSLRGAVLREIDLLSFLQRNKVHELRLDNVRLEEGSFQSVFDFCTRPDSMIKAVCCRDLYEDLMVYFLENPNTESGEQEEAGNIVQERRTTLFRSGKSIELPIAYLTAAMPIGRTIRDVKYLGSIQRDFGPPYWLNRETR